MNLTETYKTSYRSLGSNKVRTFLTMLGVIIGVFAVSTLISLGRGIQNYITDQFDAIGSGLIFIVPGRADFTGDPAESFTKNKLAEEQVKLLETYAKDWFTYQTPSIRVGETVSYKNKDYAATVDGSNHQSPKVFTIGLTKGRFFTKTEEKSKAKVVVLGPLVAEELFSNQSPIGKRVKISGDSYEVIGVYEKKSLDFDESVTMPYTTMQHNLEVDNFSSISVKLKDTQSVDLAIKQLELALLRDLEEDDFSVLSQEDLLQSINQILGVLTAGLGAIAGISLVVGGIGIMNIMLVSVTERTREIGLRKAIGATSHQIATQFLLEATTISVLGGMIGLLFGYLATLIARNFIRAEIPWWGVIVAFGFSVLVGVLFGTYPAVQASKKDPIEALRYE